jgi:fluoroacetyl-CoA thioesterase
VKPGLAAGASDSLHITVTEEMTARLEGREIHRLYATFWMAYHFEVVARRVLEPFLEAHEEGIGSRVEVLHLAPVPIGATVDFTATFTGFEGREMMCRVEANWRGNPVGRGRQGQYILDRTTLESRLAGL